MLKQFRRTTEVSFKNIIHFVCGKFFRFLNHGLLGLFLHLVGVFQIVMAAEHFLRERWIVGSIR